MVRYSEEVKKFIADHVKGRTTKELADLVNDKFDLNVTVAQMKSFKANHGLKSHSRCGLPPGSPSKVFPADVKQFIVDNYVGTGPTEMTSLLNEKFDRTYTTTQIKTYYKNHKLNSGLSGRFEKGSKPWNKGRKGCGGWEPTQFKKGNRPHNYQPIGSERVNGDGYVDIKVADPNKWRGKHILIWEQHNGPVPAGHAVIFGDGNKRNFDINNLILVTRKQLLKLNQMRLIQNDADLTRTAITVVDIIHKIEEVKNDLR